MHGHSHVNRSTSPRATSAQATLHAGPLFTPFSYTEQADRHAAIELPESNHANGAKGKKKDSHFSANCSEGDRLLLPLVAI